MLHQDRKFLRSALQSHRTQPLSRTQISTPRVS
uniref:Uncharacterized protein n=1 Tax=Anguilla anguilla TaxID=7936 RepID=A0A0E9Q663_ANGAN